MIHIAKVFIAGLILAFALSSGAYTYQEETTEKQAATEENKPAQATEQNTENTQKEQVSSETPVEPRPQQSPTRVEITNPQDFPKSSDLLVINHPKDESNTIEQWVRTILIPIILWLMAKIVMYNVNRYHLIKALYTDISQQVLSQLEWLSRIELWILKKLEKNIPPECEPKAHQLFGAANGSFSVYQESLKDIKSYLWGQEIDGVHDLYAKLQSVRDTLNRALSFQKEYKVLTEPHSLTLDSRQLSVFQNEQKLLFNVEASYYEARETLLNLLAQCFEQVSLPADPVGEVENYESLQKMLADIEGPEAKKALRRIARGVFFDEKRWYLICCVLPLLPSLSVIMLLSPISLQVVFGALMMIFVIQKYIVPWCVAAISQFLTKKHLNE